MEIRLQVLQLQYLRLFYLSLKLSLNHDQVYTAVVCCNVCIMQLPC